jgi:hypothetical protein
MHGETPGHVVSIAPTLSQETISITHGVLPRADQPNRPAGTGHSAAKSSPSAIACFRVSSGKHYPPGRTTAARAIPAAAGLGV